MFAVVRPPVMRRSVPLAAMALLLAPAFARSQAAEEPLVAQGARLERVATGFRFAEGPVWWRDRLVVSDVQADTVYTVDPATGARTVLVRPSRWTNGHAVDAAGNLYAAEHAGRQVTRRSPDGRETVLAARYGGKRLNSPNDLIVRRSDGAVFFTDPTVGMKPPAAPRAQPAELGFTGVYRIDAGAREPVLVTRAVREPNGLALSPDQSRLYVTDTATGAIWAFELNGDAEATGRIIATLADPSGRAVVDGMVVDAQGRLWIAAPGGVSVLSPDGAVLGRISVPEPVTDVTWGGSDRRDLYITAGTSVYRIRTAAPGAIARQR